MRDREAELVICHAMGLLIGLTAGIWGTFWSLAIMTTYIFWSSLGISIPFLFILAW
jgi:hypothetical protein